MTTMKPNQPSLCKRYACDRCREQKLRCSRSSSGDGSCERCLKSKSSCVTSYARPLGRPPLHSSIDNGNQHRHQHSRFRVQVSNADDDSTRPASSLNQVKEKRHSENCSHYAWHQFTTADNPLLSPCSCPSSMAHGPDASGATTHAASFQGAPGIIIPQQQAMPDNQLDSSHFINGGWDTGGFDDIGAADFELLLESSPREMQDLQFDHVAYASPTVEHVAHDESTADTDDDAPPSRGSCAASSTLMTVGNIFHEIANLNHQRLDSANLCDTKLLHEALFGMQPPRSPHDGQEGCMPLRRVFDVAVRFVWALQTMNPVACGTGLARPSPPALSVQLMVLSTYLELGQLLDRVLTRMNDDPAPHRRLAKCGQQASRHGTMLAQVIEHQLHSIERLIGLPEEFRLWSRQDSYVGILDQDRPSELTLTVMGQAMGTFKSLKQTMDKITTAPE